MKRFFLLFSLLFCLVSTAHAQEDRARAEAALKTGVKQYKEGKYSDAVASYQDAAKYAPNAASPYREMGKAYENLSKTQEAIDAYEEYIRRRPAAADTAEIQARVVALQAKLTKTATVKPIETKVAEPKVVAEVKTQAASAPASQEAAPTSVKVETPLALATPIKPERNFKVRPSRVLSLGLAAATVVGTSVFLFGGFDNLGGNADAAAGNVGDIQGVARGLQSSSSTEAKMAKLSTLSFSVKF